LALLSNIVFFVMSTIGRDSPLVKFGFGGLKTLRYDLFKFLTLNLLFSLIFADFRNNLLLDKCAVMTYYDS